MNATVGVDLMRRYATLGWSYASRNQAINRPPAMNRRATINRRYATDALRRTTGQPAINRRATVGRRYATDGWTRSGCSRSDHVMVARRFNAGVR